MTDSPNSEIRQDEGLVQTQWEDLSLMAQHGDRMVYRARRFGRWFVLKTYADQSPAHCCLLRKEFDLGCRLDSPHIVQTLNLEQVAGVGWCIVMEYIDGVSLSDFLATKPDRTLRRRLLLQLLEAVHYLHSRQMIHLDLKPSNILVTHNGHNIKLIDFGLSRVDADERHIGTSGTTGYMAPEQTAGLPTDCRSDIYALGKLLPLLCPRYKRIARRCTQENPNRRFPSCDAILQAIHRHEQCKKWLPLCVAIVCLITSLWLSLWLLFRPNPREQVIQQAQDLINQQYQLICSQPPSSLQEYHATLSYFYERCAVVRDSVAATIEDDALQADFVNAAVVKAGQLGTTYSEFLSVVQR